MTIALCPGSFDPITFGHIDLIRRAAALFDEVIVGVARNSGKNYWFTELERLDLARSAVTDIPRVSVEMIDGLVADFACERGVQAIVKGVRTGADYDGEMAMGLLNRNLGGVETLLLISDPAFAHISSSFAKDIAYYDGACEGFVPEKTAHALRQRAHEKRRANG